MWAHLLASRRQEGAAQLVGSVVGASRHSDSAGEDDARLAGDGVAGSCSDVHTRVHHPRVHVRQRAAEREPLEV